jgi:hypothetical protein
MMVRQNNDSMYSFEDRPLAQEFHQYTNNKKINYESALVSQSPLIENCKFKSRK